MLRSCLGSATSTYICSRKAPTRARTKGSARTSCVAPAVTQPATASTSRSGRRTRAASMSSATSKTGAHARRRWRCAAQSGIWEGLVPGIGHGTRYKYRIVSRDGSYQVDKADPYGFRCELPPATASVVWDLDYSWGDGDWMRARRAKNAPRRADLDLRGPPGIVDARPGGGAPLARLPRDRAQAGGARAELRLLARRAAAHRGAPVLSVVGLPGDRVLRADVALRHAAGLHVVRRLPAPAGDRRDPRLDAGALPHRRARPDLLRRHAPVRTRGPAAGDARRMGQRDLQLRPQGGAQLPDLQRELLAGPLSHRRAARRRGGVDALPRLRPEGRRVDPQPVRRQREPRGDRVPAPVQPGHVPRAPRHADHRRGVDVVAQRVAADVHRRPGLRHEVGHGLDARHAVVLPGGPDRPPLPPPQADVPEHVLLERELRAAAVTRRGGARQGLADRQDARRRVAALREHAADVRVYVGAAGEEADVPGRRDRAAVRVGARPQRRLAPAGRIAAARAADDVRVGAQSAVSRPSPRCT